MKQVLLAAGLFALGMITSEFSHHFIGNALKIETGDAAITMGKTSYPSDYGFSDSVYLVMDKETRADDASIVLREAGNARAEIGLVEDNNIHIKTVTGRYGSEIFVDRFLIRSSGEVDSVGKIFRQYANEGTPTIAIGNSDGSALGSGLELTYNFDKQVSGISSISRDIAYRPLSLSADSFAFHTGLVQVTEDPAVQLLSGGQLTVFNGLHFGNNQTYRGGEFFPGSLYKTEDKGLVLAAAPGSENDFVLANRAGDDVMRVPGGEGSVEFTGDTKTSGVAAIGVFSRANLPAPQEGGIIYVTDGAGGAPVLAFSDGQTWKRSDTLAILN